jgi:hypothetical protein
MDHSADGSLILLLLLMIVASYCIQILFRVQRHFSREIEANVKNIAVNLEQDAASEAVRTVNEYDHSDDATVRIMNKDKKILDHRLIDTSTADLKIKLDSQFPVEEVIETDLDDNLKWRCVCEQGFLPPGMLKSFSGMESMLRTSTGKCYHKTT